MVETRKDYKGAGTIPLGGNADGETTIDTVPGGFEKETKSLAKK